MRSQQLAICTELLDIVRSVTDGKKKGAADDMDDDSSDESSDDYSSSFIRTNINNHRSNNESNNYVNDNNDTVHLRDDIVGGMSTETTEIHSDSN